MAIGVKVLPRPERQVSYVRAALKGMVEEGKAADDGARDKE